MPHRNSVLLQVQPIPQPWKRPVGHLYDTTHLFMRDTTHLFMRECGNGIHLSDPTCASLRSGRWGPACLLTSELQPSRLIFFTAFQVSILTEGASFLLPWRCDADSIDTIPCIFPMHYEFHTNFGTKSLCTHTVGGLFPFQNWCLTHPVSKNCIDWCH